MPFGTRVHAWRHEIKKIGKVHFDPLYTNIKMQDEADMATLKRGMHVSFEYSRLPFDNYIETVAGCVVFVYRNELLAKISRGKEIPVGFNEDQWHCLVMLETSPSHAHISAKVKLANTSWINPGRTGLKGIAGVTKELAERLGHEPKPEELEDELRLDKDYSCKCAAKGKPIVKAPMLKDNHDLEDSNNSCCGKEKEHLI